ncbi:MAG: hypothetical protein B7Y02_13750 [Rhodobacterales bacterium 17-64-5]|nr:MAG: hypothetical protein B7Y02_13750 [Rhodobacterales bacterium 17-64-5]
MIRLTVLLCAMLVASGQAHAQTVTSIPPLGADIAASPRLVGEGAVIAKVNAALARRDQRDLDAITCFGGKPDGPFRTVEVIADGPEFLSLIIRNSSYCAGAAHPWWSQEILTFDLETGSETDLLPYLPAAFGTDPQEELAVLFLNTVADLPGDCVQVYTWALRDGHLRFDLGVVKAESALMLWPSGLAYVDRPCLDTAYVSMARLQEAGFHAKLIRALLPSR